MIHNEPIVCALFATKALRISPSDQPFFYTSGTIGPYYINTHFLFGSESEANEMLVLIETAAKQPLTLSAPLWTRIEHQYHTNATYRMVIDELVNLADKVPFDFISGGERRDYFFSLPVSQLLRKPHVSILKTGEAYLFEADNPSDRLLKPDDLVGKTALHISDLVTEASSYIRTWIPTVKRLGAAMPHSLTVVDRDQGGYQSLTGAGTTLQALTLFSPGLFDHAYTAGLITKDQHQQILQFLIDPALFQSHFLKEHPHFLNEQIENGGKNAERAKLLMERISGQ